MSTIKPESLESAQVYPDRFGRKGDVYTRLFCQRCACLLPEGATEDDELCASCQNETIGNNAEPIRNINPDAGEDR